MTETKIKTRGPRPGTTSLHNTVGCTLTPERRAILRDIALERDVAMSRLVRELVSNWIDEHAQEDPGDGDS
jgi:hypothetical protein